MEVFLIDGPEVDVPVRPPPATQSHYASISDAWNSFIAPALVEPARRQAVTLDDSKLAVRFRFPADATPPSRPVQSTIRVPLFAARTLNDTGQCHW